MFSFASFVWIPLRSPLIHTKNKNIVLDRLHMFSMFLWLIPQGSSVQPSNSWEAYKYIYHVLVHLLYLGNIISHSSGRSVRNCHHTFSHMKVPFLCSSTCVRITLTVSSVSTPSVDGWTCTNGSLSRLLFTLVFSCGEVSDEHNTRTVDLPSALFACFLVDLPHLWIT